MYSPLVVFSLYCPALVSWVECLPNPWMGQTHMGIDKGSRTLAWSLTLSSVELFFAVVKDRVVKGKSYLQVELTGIVID